MGLVCTSRAAESEEIQFDYHQYMPFYLGKGKTTSLMNVLSSFSSHTVCYLCAVRTVIFLFMFIFLLTIRHFVKLSAILSNWPNELAAS